VEAGAPKPLSEAERDRLNRLLSEGQDEGGGAR